MEFINWFYSGVSIKDTHKLFGNHYLDALFKPQWERFGIEIGSPSTEKENGTAKENGIDANGKLPEGHPKPDQSTCCAIAWQLLDNCLLPMLEKHFRIWA